MQHLVQLVVGIDDEVEAHVVRQALVGIVGIVAEVLREGPREHMLDRGNDGVEIVLARDEAVNVVTVDVDNLVDAVVVGIDFQVVKVQAFAVGVHHAEVMNRQVARDVVQRVAPERSGRIGRQTVVGILARNAQPRQVHATGGNVEIKRRVGAIELGSAIELHMAIGVVEGQCAREALSLLVHIGFDILVAVSLEVDKGDVSLQMTRHVATAHHGIDLGIHSHLVEQVALVEQGAQLQAVGLDVATDVGLALMTGQRAVDVGIAQRCTHLAIETHIAALGVHLAVKGHIATMRDDAARLRRQVGHKCHQARDVARTGIDIHHVKVDGAVTALSRNRETAAGIEGQTSVGRTHPQHGHLDALAILHDLGSDRQGVVERLEFRHKCRQVAGRNGTATRAHPQGHLADLAAQVLERRELEVQVVEGNVAGRQPQFDVLHVECVVGDMHIGRQPLERETALLIKRQPFHLDVKVVVLQAGQRQVGTQVAHGQVVDVETSGPAWLVEHVVGECRTAHHHSFDPHVERLGRLVVLGLERVDDELHIGGAVLVWPRHMALQSDDFGIGDHDVVVGDQVFQADAGPQLIDGEQRVALLVMDEHLLEFQLIERRHRHRADVHLGVEKLAQRLLALTAQAFLHRRQQQQHIGQRNNRHHRDQQGHDD